MILLKLIQVQQGPIDFLGEQEALDIRQLKGAHKHGTQQNSTSKYNVYYW